MQPPGRVGAGRALSGSALHATGQYGACESPRALYNAAPCEKHHQVPQLHNVHTGVLLGEALPTVLFPHATNASQNAIVPSIGVHGYGQPVSTCVDARQARVPAPGHRTVRFIRLGVRACNLIMHVGVHGL